MISNLPLQALILVGFGAFCFGVGYLTAFIVTRNQWRDEMIKRRVARFNWMTGKWEWGAPPSEHPSGQSAARPASGLARVNAGHACKNGGGRSRRR